MRRRDFLRLPYGKARLRAITPYLLASAKSNGQPDPRWRRKSLETRRREIEMCGEIIRYSRLMGIDMLWNWKRRENKREKRYWARVLLGLIDKWRWEVPK